MSGMGLLTWLEFMIPVECKNWVMIPSVIEMKMLEENIVEESYSVKELIEGI